MSEAATASAAPAPSGEPSTSGQEASNVLYIGHIPHGFYEEQIQKFFSQFGRVSKVRVSRNKKTGKPKHYAFLQFQSPEVARIAAEAMDNYMLFKNQLVVRVMAARDVHERIWKGANRKFAAMPWRRIEAERHNAERTPQQLAVRTSRVVKRDRLRARRLAESGIEYEYEPLAKAPAAAAGEQKQEATEAEEEKEEVKEVVAVTPPAKKVGKSSRAGKKKAG